MTELNFRGKYFGETNQGRVRTNNEDTYICQKIWDDSHILCAAIDGLGGYEGGEMASELARIIIIKHLEEFASKKIGDLLKAALVDANNQIICQHKARPKVSQMGCVASVGIVDLYHGTITIAHVGDSRIYQFVNGELKKLTHDHSLVGYREEIGELSEEDAMNHPKRNVIDKFLGEQHLDSNTESYIEISVWPIIGETQYLFCSDGLTDLVTSAQISKILSSERPIKEKVETLISFANEAGGKDNITVVLTDIKVNGANKAILRPENEGKVQEPAINENRSRHKSFIYGGILGLILGASIIYIFQRIIHDSNELETHTRTYTGKQWFDFYENIELRRKNAILEDSIAKLSAKYKIKQADSTINKTIDIHSLD